MPRHGILIGAGGVARLAHVPAYGLIDQLDLAAAVDPRIPLPDLGDLAAYPSLDAALAEVPAEFVDVCTPTASHQAVVLDALARGLHVFCEKPVAITAEGARELAAAARAAGRVLFPCHQYRENPAWRALRRAVESGAIGRWHLAEFHVYRLEADRGATPDAVPWRGRRDSAMGGVLLDHGTHLLYLMHDMAGLPVAVEAHLSRLGHPGYDVEDTAHVLLDYEDRLATLTLTWAGRERENRIRFIGSEGMAEWVGGQLRVVAANGRTEVSDFSAQLDKREYAGWMGRTLERFAEAIERGESEESLVEILDVARLLEACYRAAAAGHRVTL